MSAPIPAAAMLAKPHNRIDFRSINAVALRALPSLLARWLPGGRLYGNEYYIQNPRRIDRHTGNFKINIAKGKWADFATDARGGDVISLAAYLHGLTQLEAARKLAEMLGIAGEGIFRG